MTNFEWSGMTFEGFYPPRRLVMRERAPVAGVAALTVVLWSLFLVVGVRDAFLPGLAVAGPSFVAGYYAGFKQGGRIHQWTSTSGGVVGWWRRRFGPRGQYVWVGLVLAVSLFLPPMLATLDRWIDPAATIPLFIALQMAIAVFPAGRLIGLFRFERRRRVALWCQNGRETISQSSRWRTTTPVYFTRPWGHQPT